MIKKITSIDDLSLKEINKIADDAIKFSLNTLILLGYLGIAFIFERPKRVAS